MRRITTVILAVMAASATAFAGFDIAPTTDGSRIGAQVGYSTSFGPSTARHTGLFCNESADGSGGGGGNAQGWCGATLSAVTNNPWTTTLVSGLAVAVPVVANNPKLIGLGKASSGGNTSTPVATPLPAIASGRDVFVLNYSTLNYTPNNSQRTATTTTSTVNQKVKKAVVK